MVVVRHSKGTGGILADFWWAFHTGDYESKTAHLSILQDGAYFRLLRQYYRTAKPIPEDVTQIVRISGAHSTEEIEAVSWILREFFQLHADGWHNKRADEELCKAKKISKMRQSSAKRRWDDKRNAKADASASDLHIRLDTQLQPHIHIQKKDQKHSAREARTAHFALPSLGEIKAYCLERKNLVDPQKWFDHYTSNGWKVGRNSMKDWRAAIRTWENNGNGRTNTTNRTEPTRQPSAQVARYHNNRAELERAFGAAAVGGNAGANSPGQAPRLSSGDYKTLEGETVAVPRPGNR